MTLNRDKDEVTTCNKNSRNYTRYSTSLTKLHDINGSPDLKFNNENIYGTNVYGSNVYGSEFNTINLKPTYYEKTVSVTVNPPWPAAAKFHERTMMNNTKRLNEDPVLTYKYLKFSPIPEDNYEIYEPIINTRPGYEDNRYGKTHKKEYLLNKKKLKKHTGIDDLLIVNEGFGKKGTSMFKILMLILIVMTIFFFASRYFH